MFTEEPQSIVPDNNPKCARVLKTLSKKLKLKDWKANSFVPVSYGFDLAEDSNILMRYTWRFILMGQEVEFVIYSMAGTSR